MSTQYLWYNNAQMNMLFTGARLFAAAVALAAPCGEGRNAPTMMYELAQKGVK